MDWLRRNWPDLIIGVALVAVIAMIVATLLSGGSLVSLVQRAPELTITDTTGTALPAAVTDSSPGAASDTAADGAAASEQGVDVFVPGVPGQQAQRSPDSGVADSGVADSGAADGGAAQASTLQDGNRGGAGGPAAGSGGPLPQASADGGFRVAAGAVDSREAAGRLAQSYRDDGYTVTVERQDDLFLLWIGPYAAREGADRVVQRLIADGLVPDALVYTYNRPDGTTAEPGTGANTGAVNSAQVEAVDPAVSGRGAAGNQTLANAGGVAGGAGGRYLQVGAFASAQSARPLRSQLEGLGLTVTSNEDTSGLVRLFVGPFGGAQLARTQTRLTAQGIDSFPVAP